jgi:hypothetical protein
MSDIDVKKEANNGARMYLFEHFKEIDNEHTKSSYLLAFEALIISTLLEWMATAPIWCKASFIIFAALSLFACLINLFFPKRAALYGKYSGVYLGNSTMEQFLNAEFQSLETQKAEAIRTAAFARQWNQIASVLLIVSLIFPALYFFQNQP